MSQYIDFVLASYLSQEFPFFQEYLKFLLSFWDFAAGKSSLNSDSYLRLEAIFGFGNTKTSRPFL